MKIAIISDTHDNVPIIKKFLTKIGKDNINTILHIGDICAPISLRLFKGKNLYFVLGNNDGDILKLKEISKENDFNFLNKIGELIYDEKSKELKIVDGNINDLEDRKIKKIALYHGENKAVLFALIYSGLYDYIVTGHTHRYDDQKFHISKNINGKEIEKDVLVINPGSFYPKDVNGMEQEFYYVILDIEKGTIERKRI